MRNEIIDVISEYESFNLFTCLNKIETIENSPAFKDLTIIEKLFLLVYEIYSYDQLLFPEEVKKRLSKISTILPDKNSNLDEVSNFIFLTLSIWKLINTQNDEEIDEKIILAGKISNSLLKKSRKESDITCLRLICLYYLVVAMYFMEKDTGVKSLTYIQNYRNLADETNTSIIIYDSYNVLIYYHFLKRD